MEHKLSTLKVLLVFTLMLVLLDAGPTALSAHAPPPPQYTLSMIEAYPQLTPAAKRALTYALDDWTLPAPKDETFRLTALMWHGTWGLATVSPHDNDRACADIDSLFWVLLVQTDNGWESALDRAPYAQQLLTWIPESELSPYARNALFPANQHQKATTDQTPAATQQKYFDYRLPWHAEEAWRMGTGYTDRWHGGNSVGGQLATDNSLDFYLRGGKSGEILSAGPGVAVEGCSNTNGPDALVIVKRSGDAGIENLGYNHLDRQTVHQNLGALPTDVAQGDPLGKTLLFGGETPWVCGWGTFTHLHFTMSGKPFTIDGYTFGPVISQELRNTTFYSSQTTGDTTAPADGANSDRCFPDVPPDHLFFDYIETLCHIGAVSGYSDGNFYPDAWATRGAASKVIILAMGAQYMEAEPRPDPFPDVPSDHPFYEYIMRMKDLEITTGYSDGTFRPEEPLTRGALAKFLTVAHDGEEPYYTTCYPPFPDVPCDHTFYPHVRRLKEIFDEEDHGLGYSDNTFHPDENITRAGLSKLSVVALGWDQQFPDVPYTHLFFKYIQSLAQRGIVSGYSDGKYYPDQPLTRGAATKLVVRGLGQDPTGYTTPSFEDVDTSNAFFQYIEYLADHEIVSGSNGNFYPDNDITRGEIAKVIVNALAKIWNVTCTYQQNPGFSDVDPSNPFYTHIQCLKELKITSGYSDGTYRPDDPISRAGAAKFIYLGFVQRAPRVPQETTDAANDDYQSAPTYAQGERYTLPAGDEDWVNLTVPAFHVMGTQATQAYQLKTLNYGINADVRIDIYDADQTLITSRSGTALEGGTRLLWVPPQAGTYYVRLTNTNTGASEGTYTQLEITTETVYFTYLPLLTKQ